MEMGSKKSKDTRKTTLTAKNFQQKSSGAQ